MFVTGEIPMPSSASVIAPGEVATPIIEQRPFVPPRETLKTMPRPENIGEAVRIGTWRCFHSRPGRRNQHPAGRRIG
jgi:hypothetical protein